MRRLIQRLYMLCGVLSAALFVAVAVLWARSFAAPSTCVLWTWPAAGTSASNCYSCASEHGGGSVLRLTVEATRNGDGSITAYGATIDRLIRIPYWPIAMATGLTSAWIIRRWRRARRRVASGACASCGYDLRATPTLCPECGTPAK